MTVEGVPTWVLTGCGSGCAWKRGGGGVSLISIGGLGAMVPWFAMSASRAATIVCRPIAGLGLDAIVHVVGARGGLASRRNWLCVDSPTLIRQCATWHQRTPT